MIKATIAAVIFCSGCLPAAQPSVEPEPTPAQQVSAESPAVAICEFALGQPAPGELQPTATRTVPTEGDERFFADYQACEGRMPVTIELRDAAVWSIRIKGAGNCIEDSICVGDSYGQSIARFPAAKRLLSREDGKTFSLFVRGGLTLIFPAESIADECYVRPESCTEQIQQSRTEAIFLYDH